MNKYYIFFAIVLFGVLYASFVINAMSSENYVINQDTINFGGTDRSGSASYYLDDTMGEVATGRSGSLSYLLGAGYREMIGVQEPFIVLNVMAQDNDTKVSYTVFDNSNKSVTVSSSSGFLVDDYIVVAENEGANEQIAFGKITSIDSNTLYVDAWDGDNEAMSLNPGGGDDYSYKLEGHNMNYEAMKITEVRTAASNVEISTNTSGGYSVYVSEDGNLRSGANEIDDVGDGAVSIGFEENGIKTFGQKAQGSGDWAVTSTKQEVAADSAGAIDQRTGVVHKVSISGHTPGGSYSQTVSYYVTANF